MLCKNFRKKAKINFLPLQPRRCSDTYASVDNLKKNLITNPKQQLPREFPILLNGIKIIINMINKIKDLKLAIIGLGYVGLPLALEFAKKEK